MSTPVERPNILLVLTDQHRWDFMGYMGQPAMQGLTPYFDRLAREGTAFTHCYSPSFRTGLVVSDWRGIIEGSNQTPAPMGGKLWPCRQR